MKTRLTSHKNRQYRLSVDIPGVEKFSQPLLAVMTHAEGTPFWNLEDIRLAPGLGLMSGQYFGQNSDDYSSRITTRTPKEFEFVKSRLREFEVTEVDVGAHEFHWCTFRGIVRGDSPEAGDASYLNRWPVWHRKATAIEMLQNIEAFWTLSQFDETSPILSRQLEKIQVANPFLQERDSILGLNMRIEIARDRSQDYTDSQGFDTPSPAPPAPEPLTQASSRTRTDKP